MIELLIFIGRVVTMNRSGLNYSLHIYKNYIINSLKTQVKTMDTSLKPRKKPSKGVIYGFEITDNNSIIHHTLIK